MTRIEQDNDKVTRIIRHCHGNRSQAESVFDLMIAHKAMSIDLPDGTISLNREEHAEFVERFSAEVEPTIWESKRLKN